MKIEEYIIEIVKRDNMGRANSQPRSELLNKLTMRGWSIGDRALRQVIANMVREKQAMIGTYDGGYFWIVDDTDRNYAISELLNKIKAVRERVEAIEEMFAEEKNDVIQQELF